ncbi:MAG: hypothetical protein MUF42_11990 [Cytophagaceae bacterium]|jgi:hypothetical protein|nr:hypothetical protein [Cytophagaceae bacterium]
MSKFSTQSVSHKLKLIGSVFDKWPPFAFTLLFTLSFSISSYSFATVLRIPPEQIDTAFVPEYRYQGKGIILPMLYASADWKWQQHEMMLPANALLKKVELIFTRYPLDPERWIRDYDSLLQKRMEAVVRLNPYAAQCPWKLILQTKASNDSIARKMFHGVVLYYDAPSKSSALFADTLRAREARQTVTSILSGIQVLEDSLVWNSLEKLQLERALAVIDWTSSMYPYGAQVLRWQQQQQGKSTIQGYVLFNDGNGKPDVQKRIGGTGGVYFCHGDSVRKVQNLMSFVAFRGNGGDVQENNLEAVWKGIRVCKGWKEIVMVADNAAAIRDLPLLAKIKFPVHSIVCGVSADFALHPHYLQVAMETGGSITCALEFIPKVNVWKEGEVRTYAGRSYSFKRGRIILLPLHY